MPARATAAVFAIVGNFEDAVYCWRNQIGRWANTPWGGDAGIVAAQHDDLKLAQFKPVADGARRPLGALRLHISRNSSTRRRRIVIGMMIEIDIMIGIGIGIGQLGAAQLPAKLGKVGF